MTELNQRSGLAGRFEVFGGYGTIALGRGSTGALGIRAGAHRDLYGIGESETWGRRGGGMRGRGPRGFNRTDERICERVCEILEEDDYVDASDVEVRVEEGEVTLSGTVGDRGEKRYAEDLIADLPEASSSASTSAGPKI